MPLLAVHHSPPRSIAPSMGSHHRVLPTLHVAPDRNCSFEQAAHDQGLRALARFDHWPLIQVPTVPIVAITAMSKMPTSTVYSIKEAPSSSLPRRRSRFTVSDICHSSCVEAV